MKAQKGSLKIFFIIISLSGGGAERILIQILNNLNRQRFKPYLVLFEKKGVYLSQLHQDIKLYDLKKRRRLDFFKLVVKLAHIIHREKPDVVVSFLSYTNIVSILAKKLSFRNPRVIIVKQNFTSESLKNSRFRRTKKWLIKKLYPLAERIIAVSTGVKSDLVKSFHIQEKLIDVIYNSVDLEKVKKLSLEAVNHSWFNSEVACIIAVGRLTKQKGFPILLQAFRLVRKKLPCNLIILGDGEERSSLENISRQLSIENDVAFLGFQNNPYKYLARSDIFVLSSRWEGFGIVIIEAMASRVPVISTRCPSGPEEIITDGLNGLLVPVGDAEAVAQAILRLLANEPFRKQLAEEGRKRAEDFKVERMVSQYEKLFEQMAAR